LNRFNALILKIILKTIKNIILIYFYLKNILKNNSNYSEDAGKLSLCFRMDESRLVYNDVFEKAKYLSLVKLFGR
jgi:hypothetical protein